MAVGFARLLAKTRVKQYTNKPMFGKPHVKFGQCIGCLLNLFETGGTLGAKYSNQLDAFGVLFLGMDGEPGSMKKFVTMSAEENAGSFRETMTTIDFVQEEFMRRLDLSGDPSLFLFEHGKKKMNLSSAEELIWQFSMDGVVLGASNPELFRKLYENTYLNISPESWKRAHSAELDIPETPEIIEYEERENDDNELFIHYCKECMPDRYALLKK